MSFLFDLSMSLNCSIFMPLCGEKGGDSNDSLMVAVPETAITIKYGGIAPPVDKIHAPDTFEQGLIKNGFVDSAQSILENNLMTMGLIQRAFKIGARTAYQIMDILFAAGVVKEFPQKDATATLDLDEETIGRILK